ncbi:MAG: aminotransferase [Sulfobacillus benefaciens]|uniref:Aminotransferase n=1 Tax=Sulfobacillus benefaciens TaxID=453960 RepID=A0A2T2XJ11_9FIRM|nr:MAG: aminotransferase [Sulfobacillus benefaciens]
MIWTISKTLWLGLKEVVLLKAEAFRKHFPIFRDSVHLCSCSEGALSDRVIVAMSEFMTSWRTQAAPWESWMEEVDRARQQFARLIRADEKDVAVVSCASEGAFHVAWDQDFTKGRSVIVTNDLEFPSVAHVWLAARPRGADVRFVMQHNGVVALEDYINAINERVALVSVPLVSYANGFRFPVEDIAKVAHKYGARVVVDAYQGAGVIPIDVNTLHADYVISGSLKYLLGSPGMAFLWVRPGIVHGEDPALTGWFARSNPFAFTPRVLDYAADARRFQTGTPAIPAAFAAAAGMSLINETDVHHVFTHISALADTLQERVQAEGYHLYSPDQRDQRGPQVTVWADNAEHLSDYLRKRNIFVSPRGKAVRMSLHFYNNEEDIEQVVRTLADYRNSTRD